MRKLVWIIIPTMILSWVSILSIKTSLPKITQKGPLEHSSLVTGPGISSSELPFEPLAEGASAGLGPNAPSIFVASSVDHLSAFLDFLKSQDQQRVSNVDFSSHVVLATFTGSVGTNGYLFKVQRVSVEGGQLRVLVASRTLTPNDYGRISSQRIPNRQVPLFKPYHVVQVPRSEFDSSIPTSWVLFDYQGQILATGGVPSGGFLFQSLGQDAPVNSQPEAPALYVAEKAEDLTAFLDFLTSQHQQTASRVDFSSYIVLAVFRGSIGSSGHKIAVEQISVEGGQLRVVVSLQSPTPTDYVRPAFTSPYNVVQVPRAGFRASVPTSWTLIDNQGHVLATGTRKHP